MAPGCGRMAQRHSLILLLKEELLAPIGCAFEAVFMLKEPLHT